MLAAVLLSIGRRVRPGYLNVLFAPRFAIPLFLATIGAFFLRWVLGRFGASADQVLQVAAIPIPDWQRIIFGRGALAHPLFYSALIPFVGAVIGVAARGLRPVFAGLAIGFAAFLAYAAWAKAPALAYLPFVFLARPWLVANALVCLFVARALLRREAA
jgi:serine protease